MFRPFARISKLHFFEFPKKVFFTPPYCPLSFKESPPFVRMYRGSAKLGYFSKNDPSCCCQPHKNFNEKARGDPFASEGIKALSHGFI